MNPGRWPRTGRRRRPWASSSPARAPGRCRWPGRACRAMPARCRCRARRARRRTARRHDFHRARWSERPCAREDTHRGRRLTCPQRMAERDPLVSYRQKRDFGATPEPGDSKTRPLPNTSDLPRFVVQEHHARRLHWDLRLEHEGALASWAVPKGIPADPERNNLAVRTEDHPIEYLDFHGEIPAGEYGAGTMRIWDRGTYELHKFRENEVMVTFHGERLHGRYVLFRTGGKNWMIHRMDPPEDPDREPMPESLAPMLARSGPLPPEDGRWAYEIKWDGVRAIGYVEGGRLRLESRNGRDITPRYPELRELGRALSNHDAVLDGEVVAFDPDGRPSFQRLQSRMHLTSEHVVRRLAQSDPVVYVIFDLLWLDGHTLFDLPYESRRELLIRLELNGPTWQTPAHHVGDGAA